MDKFAFTPVESKSEFAVKKKIGKIRMRWLEKFSDTFVVPGDQYIVEAQLIWQPF